MVVDTPYIYSGASSLSLNGGRYAFYFGGNIGYEDEYQVFYGTPDCNSGQEINDFSVSEDKQTIHVWLPEIT